MIIHDYTLLELQTAAAHLIDAYNYQDAHMIKPGDLGVIIGWLMDCNAISKPEINQITGDIDRATIHGRILHIPYYSGKAD